MKSIAGDRSLTFSRVHPRMCSQCSRPLASNKPLLQSMIEAIVMVVFLQIRYIILWGGGSENNHVTVLLHTHARRLVSRMSLWWWWWWWWVQQIVRPQTSRYFIPSLSRPLRGTEGDAAMKEIQDHLTILSYSVVYLRFFLLCLS